MLQALNPAIIIPAAAIQYRMLYLVLVPVTNGLAAGLVPIGFTTTMKQTKRGVQKLICDMWRFNIDNFRIFENIK
ncbi:hypothetical protein GCM10028895_08450 [Pontibacter rugosus]